jgi:hypothetical protein
MEYVVEQSTKFKQEFATRRKRQILLVVPIVAAMLAFALFQDEAAQTVMGIPMSVMGPVFAVLIVGAIGYSFVNWRCPACRAYLGKRLGPQFCARCGVALQ